MNENLIPFQAAARSCLDPAIYTAPDDVVGDPSLTTADKRAILASWVSDARAVENAPTMRHLDSGSVVEVETILEALRALDRTVGGVVRLPTRPVRADDPDDDGPPPTPARAGTPPRPIHVNAYGAGRRWAGGTV